MINIRKATSADGSEILKIYAYYVKNTQITFECAVPSEAEFAKRVEKTLEKFPFLVAEENGEILGYACANPFHEREAYAYSVETTIYMKKGFEGRGTGGLLYSRLEELLKKQNVTNLNACIAYPNPQSIAFHEKMGYKTAAHFHKCGFKLGRWWDMIWMEKLIASHKIPPEPLLPPEG